ncbi:MAG: YdcF family protein [Betaproteobacteria bacterium]|nr:YdcF family protein [Betaproteobacteria bacterium]
MSIYLHKILPLLISPLFLFIALSFFYSFTLRLKVLFLSTVAISILSTPMTAQFLWDELESEYTLKTPKEIINSDAIVVLSGNASPIETEEGFIFQWADPDRFFGGISLFKTGKAPTLIFTGGQLPWDKGDQTEGDYLKGEAISRGVPEDHILVTRAVQNTAQEALAVKALLGGNTTKIILVTSAFHMPRATSLFEAEQLIVIPYPVNFKSINGERKIMSFIPSTGGLNDTFNALREFLGRLYYRFKL